MFMAGEKPAVIYDCEESITRISYRVGDGEGLRTI